MSGESKNIFTKTGDDGISGTICEYELDKSIDEHKWKINLLNVKTRKAMIGVAPIDFDINSSNYKTLDGINIALIHVFILDLLSIIMVKKRI